MDGATSFCALGYHTWRQVRPGLDECIYCHELTEDGPPIPIGTRP